MAIVKIEDGDTYDDKHIVIHCGTGQVFACDTLEEAHALADTHDTESSQSIAQDE
jgi:hypothetical protein